jgi:hypothetical protein
MEVLKLKVEHQANLTASELSWIWTTYQGNTMAICVLRHFLANIEDPAIGEVLDFALEISEKYVLETSQVFESANYPLPQAFSEKDVNKDAPRLFSDVFYLQYVEDMGKFGIESYGMALATVSRKDIYELYTAAMTQTIQLRDKAVTLLQEKGLYHRDTGLPTPGQIDFVDKKSFLTGFFGERRPLLGMEISNLWYASVRNGLGQAVIQGFSQVAKTKEVREYFIRGRNIAGKRLETLGTVLDKNYLSRGTFNLTGEVTESTVPPFSDKLMMFHIAALSTSAIGQYGVAMASSPRHDLGVMYAGFTAEIAKYANDGAQIMINHRWMEQPPKAADRKKLSQ